MSVLVLQLGDIHIKVDSDEILRRGEQIAAAAAAEADSQVDAACILVTGDVAQTGAEEEFRLAIEFLSAIRDGLAKKLGCPVQIITIPGNHDLHLADDQTARNQIIDGISTATVPPPSILDIVLASQRNYFAFADKISAAGQQLTYAEPFFRTVRIQSQNGTLDLHLVNSAWMSTRHESPGSLLFPVDRFAVNGSCPPTYSISVVHHPFNWFSQPTTLRPLRDKIEHARSLSE